MLFNAIALAVLAFGLLALGKCGKRHVKVCYGGGQAKWDGELSSQEIKTIRSFRFHTGRSIEHLHPQTDNGDFDWNDGVPPKKDLFCNLCLLTPSMNSKLSNDSVAVKLARVKDLIGKSGLQSIKMLLMYKECDGKDSMWTPETAQIHLMRIKKVLMDSYLYDQD